MQVIEYDRIHIDDLRATWGKVFAFARYVDVGVGWQPVVDAFVSSVIPTVAAEKERWPDVGLWVNGVREKMGKLKIDLVTEDLISAAATSVRLAQALAEERSAWICEVCGQPGHIRIPPEGASVWIQCRCDAHCLDGQRGWPPPVRQALRPLHGRVYVYDRDADAMIETEGPERWK
jgi:hypothetical protein